MNLFNTCTHAIGYMLSAMGIVLLLVFVLSAFVNDDLDQEWPMPNNFESENDND